MVAKNTTLIIPRLRVQIPAGATCTRGEERLKFFCFQLKSKINILQKD